MKTIPAEAVPVQDLIQVQSAAAVAAQPAAEVALLPNSTRRRGQDINLLRAQSPKC